MLNISEIKNKLIS